MALYTPFFQKTAQSVSEGYGAKRTGELMQSAYMGDPNALGELYQINPNAAMAIEQQGMKKQEFQQGQQDRRALMQQRQQESRISAEDRAREIAIENEGLIQETFQAMSKLPYEEAKQYGASVLQRVPQLQEAFDIEQYTPEMHAQVMQVNNPGDPKLADQRERKVDQYMKQFGMTREEAIQRVDSSTMMDDKGNVALWNPVTQSLSLLTPDNIKDSPSPNVTFNTEIGDLKFDPGKGTGFAASLVGLWNSTVGQIPFVPIGTERAEVAQNLRVLERDAIRALASSNRPPVIEQQRIGSIIPQPMAWLENPEEARLKMTNFVDLMAQQYIDDLRFSSNPRNAEADRDDSARRMAEIESVVGRVLTPEAKEQMFNMINGVEQVRGRISELSDAELLDMDPPSDPVELDLYIERLESMGPD